MGSSQELHKKGKNYADNKKYKEAIECFTEAIFLGKNKKLPIESYYYDRGNVYLSLNDYENAALDFKEAITIGSENTQKLGKYHAGLGFSYYRLGKYHKAVTEFTQAVKLDNTVKSYKKYLKRATEVLPAKLLLNRYHDLLTIFHVVENLEDKEDQILLKKLESKKKILKEMIYYSVHKKIDEIFQSIDFKKDIKNLEISYFKLEKIVNDRKDQYKKLVVNKIKDSIDNFTIIDEQLRLIFIKNIENYSSSTKDIILLEKMLKEYHQRITNKLLLAWLEKKYQSNNEVDKKYLEELLDVDTPIAEINMGYAKEKVAILSKDYFPFLLRIDNSKKFYKNLHEKFMKEFKEFFLAFKEIQSMQMHWNSGMEIYSGSSEQISLKIPTPEEIEKLELSLLTYKNKLLEFGVGFEEDENSELEELSSENFKESVHDALNRGYGFKWKFKKGDKNLTIHCINTKEEFLEKVFTLRNLRNQLHQEIINLNINLDEDKLKISKNSEQLIITAEVEELDLIAKLLINVSGNSLIQSGHSLFSNSLKELCEDEIQEDEEVSTCILS